MITSPYINFSAKINSSSQAHQFHTDLCSPSTSPILFSRHTFTHLSSLSHSLTLPHPLRTTDTTSFIQHQHKHRLQATFLNAADAIQLLLCELALLPGGRHRYRKPHHSNNHTSFTVIYRSETTPRFIFTLCSLFPLPLLYPITQFCRDMHICVRIRCDLPDLPSP